ncbi:hypothetical protein NDU88_002513 [Pleurodeles waltl]|uniref:Uncharacterized protein n=1 Tax=Pleurodeles waltl TaxID=8319 RepID=A0AAV7VDI0_PLEWA|nr:hypothetical protein NDU88_002513 [Pleurodeles waltl]
MRGNDAVSTWVHPRDCFRQSPGSIRVVPKFRLCLAGQHSPTPYRDTAGFRFSRCGRDVSSSEAASRLAQPRPQVTGPAPHGLKTASQALTEQSSEVLSGGEIDAHPINSWGAMISGLFLRPGAELPFMLPLRLPSWPRPPRGFMFDVQPL